MDGNSKSSFQKMSEFIASVPIAPIVMSLIGIIAIGLIVLAIYNSSFKIFGEPNIARGLITFTVAILTVTLAIILVLSAILGSSPDFEKRFTLGKEILMVFVGILGTIMGFYYGENRISPDVARELSTPPKVSVNDVEKKGFNAILSNDFLFAAEAFAEAYRLAPTYHNVDEINKLFQSQKEAFVKADSDKDEVKKKLIWSKILCDISKNYLWGISTDLKAQFQEKLTKEGYDCSQTTQSNSTSNISAN